MIPWFVALHPVWQALLAGLFTWGVTALGAATVFLNRQMHRKPLDAMLEPVAAVIGAAAVVVAAPLLPYALSFAAGAMVYVVVEELIPESHRQGNVDLATFSLMIGFAVMMVLDVALG